MREIQEEFRTKKIEINANLSPDVKDLLKCVLRRNPDQRPNIRQVLEHPALQKRVDEFNQPISEEQFTMLITAYMQNCGMSNKRDHPEEIKKYKASHKEFEAEWFSKGGNDSGGFFDDIPVQFPPSNYYGPVPTPNTVADPGFFDNIPENLSFKKSRQGSYRGSERGKIGDQKQPNSQPGSSTRNIDAFATSLEGMRKSDSYGDQNENQQSSRGIVMLASSDPNSSTNSSRNVVNSISANQQGSFKNLNFPQHTTSIQALGGERKDDHVPSAVISVKKISSDNGPLTFPNSKPDPLKQSSHYPVEPSNLAPSQLSHYHSPVYVPPEKKNTGNVSKFETNSANYLDSQQFSTQQHKGPSNFQSFRIQNYNDGQNYHLPTTQLNQSANPSHLTNGQQSTGQVTYQSPVSFVNYSHTNQTNQTTIRNPYTSTPNTSADTYSVKTIGTTDHHQNGSRQSEANQEEVRYFPYEISEGNHSAVLNSLSEEFKRQEEKSKAHRSQFNNTYTPTVDTTTGIKKIQIDTRVTNPSHSNGQKTLPPLPTPKKTETNQPTKTSNLTGNNVTFVDHFSKPIGQLSGQQRHNISSNDDRKTSYETGTGGAIGLTRYAQISLPTPMIPDAQSRQVSNVKFVDYQSNNNSSNGQPTQAMYQRLGVDGRVQNFGGTETNNVMTLGTRTTSFLKVQARQGSLDKRRDYSADPSKGFGQHVLPAFQK